MTSLLRIKQIAGCKKTGIPALIPSLNPLGGQERKQDDSSSSEDWKTHHMLARIRFTKTNEWRNISASIGNSII